MTRILKNRLWIVLLAMSAIFLAASCRPNPPKPKAFSANAEHGQRLFSSTCAACHRADSTAPLSGPGLKGIFDKQYLPSGAPANDERVHEVIVMGRRSMPSYGQVFDDTQIHDLIAYLHTL